MDVSRVLVIGDPHCPGMHKHYPAFLSKIYKKHRCNKVVCIGDLVDNHQVSFHGSEVDAVSAPQEAELARKQIVKLTERFPKAEMMMGNHDALHVRQALAAGLPYDVVRGFNDYWGLPKSWKVHDRFDKIAIDNVLYSHGETGSAGKYAAINQAGQTQPQSQVIGHFHACFGVWFNANDSCRTFGAASGCGIDHAYLGMRYGRKFPRKPILGCLVVIDGETVIPEPMRL